MSDLTQDYAPGWKPEPGAVVIGKITRIDVGYSNQGPGGNYPIVTVNDENTRAAVAVHAFHSALFAQLLRLKPLVGERIGIQYHGQRPSKRNPSNTVSVYTVRIDGRSGGDVWQELSHAPQPQPQPQDTPLPGTEQFTPPARTDDDIPF
jgi:hypothetical protein